MKNKKILFFSPYLNRFQLDGAGTRTLSLLNVYIHLFYCSASLEKGHLRIFLGPNPLKGFFWPAFSSKIFAACKALFFGQHYIKSKHVSFLTLFVLHLFVFFFSPYYFYIHFLWSYPLFKSFCRGKVLIIDTHNYDNHWWDNLESNSRWPWEKSLCRISKQRILEILNDLPKNTLLIHVSHEDAYKYREHRPDLIHLVLPNGCTMRPRSSDLAYSVPFKKIYFLGALNLQITRDAMLHFDKNFWPHLSTFCEFHLIGSGPASFWKPFCAERGWHLHNNVPDDDLTRLLHDMHYLVLPFTYGAGSKLKFIDACARGIPVVSTPPGVCGFAHLPPTVRISEDPQQWASWISSPKGPTEAETAACLAFAKEYSWDNLVAKVWPQIQIHPPVP